MLNIIQNIFRIEELRQRIFFTLFMLFIFRLGAHIPTPGIDGAALTAFFDAQQGSILRFSAVVIDSKREPVGTRIFGPVAHHGEIFLQKQIGLPNAVFFYSIGMRGCAAVDRRLFHRGDELVILHYLL